jgi:hypothetical protein
VNVLETIGNPPREEPELALDKLARPDETAAALDASEEPESTSEPYWASNNVIWSIGIPNIVAMSFRILKISAVVKEEKTTVSSKTNSMLILDLHFQPYSLYPLTQVRQFVVEDIQVWQGDSQAKHCEVVESAGNVYPSLQLVQLWAVSHPVH